MATTEKPKRILPPVTLEQSYALARERVLGSAGAFKWAVSNVPREEQQYLFAILALSLRSATICNLHIGRKARLEMLDDLREDLRNNFMEEESTDQFPALLDTMRKHSIPQQYLHDIVSAADYCFRLERFETFDDWLQFGCRMGGGTLLAASSVFGIVHPHHEQAAISCGQAIWLTWLLDHVGREIQTLEYYLPVADRKEAGIELERHNAFSPGPEMLQWVRTMATRIDRLFADGIRIIGHLELDGQRSLKSLIGYFWNRLDEMKSNPGEVLSIQKSPSDHPAFRFRFLHIMGLEGRSPALRGRDSGRNGH